MPFWRKIKKDDAAWPHPERRTEPSERTRLGPGWRFKGRAFGKGQLIVQSTFEGEMELQGSMTLDPSGTIKGMVRAEEGRIGGTMTGSLTCGRLVVLEKSARLEGDVATPRLQMASGARLNGRVVMDSRRKPVQGEGK